MNVGELTLLLGRGGEKHDGIVKNINHFNPWLEINLSKSEDIAWELKERRSSSDQSSSDSAYRWVINRNLVEKEAHLS